MPTRHVTRRILVPLDGSGLDTLTLPHLRALATVESEILLLRVSPEPELTLEAPTGAAARREDAQQRSLADCRSRLRAFARTLRDITPHVEVLVRLGAAADEILETAEEREIDLILMASHRRGSAESLVDSVGYRVAQAATVPVMLVHEHDGPPGLAESVAHYGRVIVPVDGSVRACAAVPVAVGLAQKLNLPLHLVRAVPAANEVVPGDARTGPALPADGKGYQAFCALLRETLAGEAHTLHACGVDASAALLTGPVVASILGVVTPHDILVMSSHGEGGVRPWLLGRVAQKLVTGTPSNVVVVPVEERKALTRSIRQQAATAAEEPDDHERVEEILASMQAHTGLPAHRAAPVR